jgi:hypothetical protein
MLKNFMHVPLQYREHQVIQIVMIILLDVIAIYVGEIHVGTVHVIHQ